MSQFMKFTLTPKRKEASDKTNGHHVIQDTYVFKDGELVVPARIGRRLKPLLVDFYACDVERFETDEPEVEGPVDSNDAE